MKRAWVLIAIVAFAAQLAMHATSLADIPGPGPRPQRPWPRPINPAPQLPVQSAVPLTYREDANANISKLVIPRRYLNQAAGNKAAGGPADAGGIVKSGNSLRTIAAGVALSLAAASVVLLRKQRRGVKIVTVVMAIALVGCAATPWLWAMPPRDKVDSGNAGGARVVIEVTDAGDAVQFIRATK